MKVRTRVTTPLPKDRSMGVDVKKVMLSVAFTVLSNDAYKFRTLLLSLICTAVDETTWLLHRDDDGIPAEIG
jgi:hypothetical protein